MNIESFGPLPPLNFDIDIEMSPGPPKGRTRFSSSDSEDENDRNNKRKEMSGSESPKHRQVRKPKIMDVSYDDPAQVKDISN